MRAGSGSIPAVSTKIIARSSNGRTLGSDPSNRGSNPRRASNLINTLNTILYGASMVKRFNQHIKTNNTQLDEATLFTNAAEKTAFVANRQRVATAFVYNFFGMLGMINATKPAQKQTVLNFLKKDKQLRIDNIDETNLDISQSVKLAHEAKFFVNVSTVNEITRFLVKLKQGQVTHIDSTIVGKWATGLTPDFLTNITDPALRRVYNQFRMDEGKTIDVSRFAVVAKSRMNKVPDSGEFGKYAKRFFGLTEIAPSATAPVAAPAAQPTAATPAQPAAPTKLSYYQRQKLKKQQAAAGTTPAPAPTTTAAPAKLNYYQKQKLKKQQAAQPAIDAAAQAAAQAAAAAALKAKEEEENRKAQAAAIKTMPKDHLMQMIDALFRSSPNPEIFLFNTTTHVQHMFNFSIVPDVYAQVADRLQVVANNMRAMVNTSDPTELTSAGNATHSALKDIAKLTGNTVTFLDIIKKIVGMSSSTARGHYGGRYAAVAIFAGEDITPAFYEAIVQQLNTDGIRTLSDTLFKRGGGISDFKKLAKIIAGNDDYFKKMCQEGYPIYAVMRYSRSWGATSTYSKPYDYAGYQEFAYQLLDDYAKPFSNIVDMVLANAGSYGLSYFEDAFVAYGVDKTTITKVQGNLESSLRMRFKEFYDTAFEDSKYAPLVRRLLRNTLTSSDNHAYDPSAPNGGGLLLQKLHDMFAKDLVQKGWSNSKIKELSGAAFTDYSVKHMLRIIGVDADELVKNHPNDPASTYIKVVKDGLTTVSPDKLAELLLTDTASNTVNGIIRAARNLQSSAQGDRDANAAALATAMLKVANGNPKMFDFQIAGEELLKLLPYADGGIVGDWLRFAKQNDNKWIMGDKLYKSIHKSRKQEYVDVVTGIVQDSIGTDVEDFVNDIVEALPPHVVQKMRSNLVGGAVLIDEIQKGELKPFDKIDASRLKKIFLYNDLDMSVLLSGVVDKKKKTETYVQFFARAKQTMKNKQILDAAKVKEDKAANAKAINKVMIQRDHAGKHGDVYPRIDKVYDANLEYPEFWTFRKEKPQEGSIVPAYHGTGGIAAGMILRYGFKVIKSSDPSVAGRMLGDGIYFSNKIDKVTQYVSNVGYGRMHGQKGYVMEMDTNLGTRNRDYRAAGIDGRDNIRSPEWCVVDPKAQLRIVKVYEVTLVSKKTVDQHLNEGVQSNGLKGFRQHLKEQVVQENGNVTSFVFRNGMIPIVDLETAAVDYVDFEEALSKKLIKEDMFDTSAQGPVIVFRGTPEQVVIDERFAEHMAGDDLQLYIQLFREEMQRM